MNFNAFTPGAIINTLYILILGLITLIRYRKTNSENKGLFLIFVLIQFFLGAFRSILVGTDSGPYVYHFEGIKDLDYGSVLLIYIAKDPLFFMSAKFLMEICTDYTWIFFVTQSIFWSLVSYTIYKQSKSCLFALFLFIIFRYHFFAMSAMRQMIALSLCLFAFNYLLSERKKKYFILIFVAYLCHASSLLLAPLYFVKDVRIYNKPLLIVMLSSSALLLAIIFPAVMSGSGLLYVNYLEDAEGGNYFAIISYILAFIFVCYYVRKVEVSREVNTFFNLSFLAFVISLMGFKIGLVFRFAMYFGFIFPIIISNLTLSIKNRKVVLPRVILFVFIIYLLTGVPKGVDNYSFFWEIKTEDNYWDPNGSI